MSKTLTERMFTYWTILRRDGRRDTSTIIFPCCGPFLRNSSLSWAVHAHGPLSLELCPVREPKHTVKTPAYTHVRTNTSTERKGEKNYESEK